MTTSTHFREYYKTISNSELLSILNNPNDYQLLALEAASQEFSNRQLSEEEIQAAKEFLDVENIQTEKRKEKFKAIAYRVKKAQHTFVDTLSPIHSGIPSTEKHISLIVFFFSGLFLYQFTKYFNSYMAYVKDIPRSPLISFLHLFPLLLLPIAIFSFWKRKKIGWILLTIFLSISTVGPILLLYQSFTWRPSRYSNFDNIFPQPSPVEYIVHLFFLIGTIYVLCKVNIRTVFSIEKQKMRTTIVVSGLVTLFLMYLAFLN